MLRSRIEEPLVLDLRRLERLLVVRPARVDPFIVLGTDDLDQLRTYADYRAAGDSQIKLTILEGNHSIKLEG